MRTLILLFVLLVPAISHTPDHYQMSASVVYGAYFELDDVFWVYPGLTINITGREIVTNLSLVVSLKNVGPDVVRDVEVRFNLSELGKCDNEVQKFEGDVPPGYAVAFVFKFLEVNDNLSRSEYDLPMLVRYRVGDVTLAQEIIVPIAVSGVPILKVFCPPLYVSGEGYYDLLVRVDNIGTAPARRVVVAVRSVPPYVTVASPDWTLLGIIPANSSKTARFKLYVTELPTSGVCAIINVTFSDERYGEFFSVAEVVPVIVSENISVTLVTSSYVPSAVFPGDKYVTIYATILNPTRRLLRDVEARLVLPPGFSPSFAGADHYSLGALTPGSAVTLTFYIDVSEDVAPDLYTLILNITHSYGFDAYSIPVIVEERAKFVVESVSPEVLTIGARGETLRITMRNVANVTASSLFVELRGGAVLKGSLSDYVGEVGPGLSFTVSFTVDVSDDAPEGEMSFDLVITWLQEDRLLQDTLTLVLRFERRKLQLWDLTALGLGVLLALLVLPKIVRWVRRG